MKISQAIKYLKDYEDQEQEIMISWNDRSYLEKVDEENENEPMTDEQWKMAVLIFDKYFGESFMEECRLAISEAKERASA